MNDTTTLDTERIVYVTEDGEPTGETAPKLAAHHENTRLHLAFSCYLLRSSDQALLITSRAASKKVWPRVWTNSVCGHPAPGEPIEEAVRRRAAFELGLPRLDGLRCVLPAYRYSTPPFEGVVENEFCPVFVAWVDDDPAPHPDEVGDWRWVNWNDYALLLNDDVTDVSYWAKDQFSQLKDFEPFLSLQNGTSVRDNGAEPSST